MMDTAMQLQVDPNGQTIVSTNDRLELIQKLQSRWPLELSKRIESQAYEKSQGIKNVYIRFIHQYFQQVQTALQNRANQQPRLMNNPPRFPNPVMNPLAQQQQSVTIANQVPYSINQPRHPPPRFSNVPQTPRLENPQGNPSNQITRLPDSKTFNSTPTHTLSYSASPVSTTTTIGLPQQMNNPNPNVYSTLQPRYPIQASGNLPPRQRMPIHTNNLSNDILHQFIVGNSPSTVSTNNPSTGDRQNILTSKMDEGSNKMPTQNRPAVMSQLTRSANSMNSISTHNTNSLRSSLPPSPSLVALFTPPQTSTVQIPPSNNITMQQSPLSNSNGPFSAGSQASSSTPVFTIQPSPLNPPSSSSSSGSGSIVTPDDDTLNLIKYLRENVHRLQLLTHKFTNEGNSEKLLQVQSIYQQIILFTNNPTYETLPNARQFRVILDRISNRGAVPPPPPPPPPPVTTSAPANVFNQCVKATNDFLLREQKERIGVTKRYLEPLSDVINGVPHKMMRLDVDQYPSIKIRSSNQSSLLSKLNEELNQLPMDVFSIDRLSLPHSRKYGDDDEEDLNKNGFILRCKLLERSNPIIPPLRLYITRSYPEQPPEVLSLTNTMPPRLEFTDGHPFFDQVSSNFVSHLFKLRPQHTVTEILYIWRQSVQTAL